MMLQARIVPSKCFVHSRRAPVLRSCGAGPRSRSVLCRAEKQDQKKDKDDEYIEALKKGGIDEKVAKQVLDKWKEVGQEADPASLRKLFAKQSFAPVAASGLQTLFDGTAAYSIFLTAAFLAAGPEFTGRNFIVFALNFLATYFAVCVVFDIGTAIAVLITAIKLQASPEAYYQALKAIAGQGKPSGLAIVDKAQAAVNAVKVAQALDAISQLLEKSEVGGKASSSVDTLTNLSAYLTLYRSEKDYKFDPTTIGMTETDASKIAKVFAEYDVDDNGRLDASEFRRMVESLGMDISYDEAKAAMMVMDENKDGYIQFDEFAKWWATKKGLVKTTAGSSSSSSSLG